MTPHPGEKKLKQHPIPARKAFRSQRPHRHTHKNPHPPVRALTRLKLHLIPARKACHARRAKRPRQGWRGRSAGMRESFAIGHGGPFDRNGLKRHHTPPRKAFRSQRPHRHTHKNPHPPARALTRLKRHPIRRERPAMPEEQSVHARDGVADPQGCGNPLRSGMAGLSIAAASPPHPSAAERPIQKNGRPGFP